MIFRSILSVCSLFSLLFFAQFVHSNNIDVEYLNSLLENETLTKEVNSSNQAGYVNTLTSITKKLEKQDPEYFEALAKEIPNFIINGDLEGLSKRCYELYDNKEVAETVCNAFLEIDFNHIPRAPKNNLTRDILTQQKEVKKTNQIQTNQIQSNQIQSNEIRTNQRLGHTNQIFIEMDDSSDRNFQSTEQSVFSPLTKRHSKPNVVSLIDEKENIAGETSLIRVESPKQESSNFFIRIFEKIRAFF